MSTHQPFNDTIVKTTSKVIWFGIQSSVPIFIAAILALKFIANFEPIMPDLKNIFMGICVFTIPLPFFLLNQFRRKQREINGNIQLGMDNAPKDLQRYMSLLIIGLSLCNLSAAFGLVLFVISGAMEPAIFFTCISFLLGFLYKPTLN